MTNTEAVSYRVTVIYLGRPLVVGEWADYYESRAAHASQVMFACRNGATVLWEPLDADGNVIA